MNSQNIDIEKLSKYVKDAKKGNRYAFEDIVRLTGDYIYYYCLMMLKNEENAKDAVQDIYIIVLQKIASVKNPRAFLGWLKMVTSNYCKNKLSASHTYALENRDGECIDEDLEDFDNSSIPGEKLENAETAELILGIIKALPDAQRECIMMYYYQELSLAQISEALGVGLNTVKSRLSYARKAIKEGVEALEKQGVKLYGASPLLFIGSVLSASASAVTAPVDMAAIFSAVSATAVTATVDAAVLQMSTVTSGYISNTLGSSFATKLAVGAATIALITGGGVATFSDISTPEKPPQQSSTAVSTATPDRAVYSKTKPSTVKKKKKKKKKIIKQATPDTARRTAKPKPTEPAVKQRTVGRGDSNDSKNNTSPQTQTTIPTATEAHKPQTTPTPETSAEITKRQFVSIPNQRSVIIPSTQPTSSKQYRIFR